MLMVGASAVLVRIRPAVVEMCVTTHALTDKVTHHRGTFVI